MVQARPRLKSDLWPRFQQCKEGAARLLDRAAIQWCKGDPSNPTVEDVLKDVLTVFINEHFLKPPGGSR
jgi:hypothetical protein